MTILFTEFGGELAALAAALLWAVATLFFARAGQQLRPLRLNLTKGVLALGMLGATLLILGEPLSLLDPRGLALLLVSGAIGIAVGDTAYFSALQALGVRRTMLLGTLVPPLTALLALAFLEERLSPGAWGGIALTVAGVAWVIGERAPGAAQPPAALARGLALGVLASLAQAVGAVLSRSALADTAISSLWAALLRLSAGILLLLVMMAAAKELPMRKERVPIAKGLWGSILFATFIGTYLGIWLQQTSLKYAHAGVAQTLFATSQLFALPLAAWSGEQVSLRAIAGAVVALGGVALLFVFP